MKLFDILRNALYKTPALRQLISAQPFTYLTLIGYLTLDGVDPDAVLLRMHQLVYGLLLLSVLMIVVARFLSHVDHELGSLTKAMKDARRASRNIHRRFAELIEAARDNDEAGEDETTVDANASDNDK